MGIFDIFRRKKVEPSVEEKKWNRMWDLWVEEKAASPYAELMTYQSEVNNGGHGQFFDNVSSCDDLERVLPILRGVLPSELSSVLDEGYAAWLRSEEDEECDPTEIHDRCDDAFYSLEGEIEKLLKEYAEAIEL